MNLDDLNAAARLKEVVGKIAEGVVESMYPRPKFATVVSVDFTTKKVVLTYAGDATNVTVDGTHWMPVAGGVVRVAGQEGARYVDEIMSGGVSISLASGKFFKVFGGATERISIADTGVMTVTTSAPDNITSKGAGAGLAVYDRDLSNDYNALYRYGNVFKIYNSASGVDRLTLDDAGNMGVASVSAAGFTASPASGGFLCSSTGYLYASAATNNWFRPWDGGNMHIKATAGGMYLDCDSTAGVNAAAFHFRKTDGTELVTIRTDGLVHAGSHQAPGNYYTTTGQFLSDRYDAGTTYADSQLRAGNNSVRASISLWTNGYASMFRMSSAGQAVYLRNYNDGGYPELYCDVVDMSSARFKRDIRPYRQSLSAGMETALSSLMKIEVVTYKRDRVSMVPNAKDGTMSERRMSALKRLNEIRSSKGLGPFIRNHECNDQCASPCSVVYNEERDLPGVIAEQMAEVLPEVVQYGNTIDVPEGIKTLSLLAVTIKALQEATLRIEALEAAIAS